MTLVSRVSAFFLAALAVALAGYSAAFYAISRNYLYQQFDSQLHNALEVLSASVEIEPDDVKWHPAEHGIELGQEVLSQVHWVVTDEMGQVIDHSRYVSRNDPNVAPVLSYARRSHASADSATGIGSWRMLQRSLAAPSPKAVELRDPHEYARVTITVGKSQSALNATLWKLALLVCALPAAVWLLAALLGRKYVAAAIEPVRAMSERAREARLGDFATRLPVGESADELAELGASFNRLLDQLQQTFERQRRFTTDAAHQLRTPLTVLQGQIDVALRKPRTTDEYRSTLATLGAEVEELGQIVETLLFLARPETSEYQLRLEPLDLNRWLGGYADRWRNHARSDDISVQCEPGLQISANESLLSQLVDNLVGNALKYSRAGTPVTITGQRIDSRIAIRVTDRGPGISRDDQASLFEPFYRSPEARRRGIAGTGLGLSIAAKIAAVFRGELTCDSELGAGSEFTLILPAIDRDSAGDESPTEAAQAAP